MPCHESNFVDPRSALDLKFNDIKVIGSSCSGCVLSAVEKGGKQERYALKRLSLKRKSHCRVALRELRILKRLRHENVVKTSSIRTPNGCDIGEVANDTFQKLDYVYLAEELLDTDLQSVISKGGKVEEKVAKLFLYQLLRGLKYVHSANVIHRDIKPGNLFVNAQDLTLKVGDFGLARIVDPKFRHSGHLTELVTTRYYRPPEVILSPGNYDSSVDIWSCGCVFAEMCTGDVLFPGQNDLQQIDCIQSWFHDGGRFMANKVTGMSQAGKFTYTFFYELLTLVARKNFPTQNGFVLFAIVQRAYFSVLSTDHLRSAKQIFSVSIYDNCRKHSVALELGVSSNMKRDLVGFGLGRKWLEI